MWHSRPRLCFSPGHSRGRLCHLDASVDRKIKRFPMSTTLKILTVSDLHQSRVLYDQLRQAVERHRPDLVAMVGDVLDATQNDRDQDPSKAECAKHLAGLPCKEIVFARGNHEDEGWMPFDIAWEKTGRPLNALHAEAFRFGPLVIVGFPCLMGEDTFFLGPRPPAPSDPADWLSPILKTYGSASRTLWLMHEPPRGTALSEEEGPLSGNTEWAVAIERYSPLMVVFGHDHNTPRRSNRWRDKIGATFCMNVGQKLDGPLHYSVIEAAFSSEKPSLPAKMKVTSYPYKQSSDVR